MGVGLLALLDWAVGVLLLAWVSCGYISTPGYLVQAPQTYTGSSRSTVRRYFSSSESTSGVWKGHLIECQVPADPFMDGQAFGSSGHEGGDRALCFLVFSLIKGGLSGTN